MNPLKKWLLYNCDVALLDIVKLYWDDLGRNPDASKAGEPKERSKLEVLLVIIFNDLLFENYDYQEALHGHMILLWLIREKYDFLQELRIRE